MSDPIEFQRRSMRSNVASFLHSGYFYEDKTDGIYRPTWKGACLMAWNLRWPVRPIRRWIRQCRAARLLGKLGLEQ